MFHHAYGLTPGLRALAERLNANGHTVHAPDSFNGRTFDNVDEAVAYAGEIGHDALLELAMQEARQHRGADVVVGFSLGTGPAQYIAQHLRRVRACLLMGGAAAPEMFGSSWRPQVALQVHLADPDEWCTPDEVGALEREVPDAQIFRYRGKGHLFVDPSTDDYDADAADQFEERLDTWLAELDASTA